MQPCPGAEPARRRGSAAPSRRGGDVRWFRAVRPRPLDPVGSIKLKLSIVVVAPGAVAFGFFWWQMGWWPPKATLISVGRALIASQVLARGMTRRLREMTAAAGAMARGDYTRRVRATSRDEVGKLAV